MKYYLMATANVTQGSWAWGEEIVSEKAICDRTPKTICPLCGRVLATVGWTSSEKIKLDKKSKLGDFIYGFFPFDVLCSKRFIQSFERAGLKGIESCRQIQLYFRKELIPFAYYGLEFGYSLKKVPFAEKQNEKRKYDKSLPRCSLCQKTDNWREIYFSEENNLDVFHIYENRTHLYCNQKFVDFCEENKFTNILEWCKEIKTD